MKIAADNPILDTIIRNKLSLDRSQGYVKPLRFTEWQLSHYASLQGNFKAASLCASGICLDFMTDSDFVKITTLCSTTAKDPAFFDLYVDGHLTDSRQPQHADGSRLDEILFPLPGGAGNERRVTIYFPYDSIVQIAEIELQSGCSLKDAEPYLQNYLCLGGSISQGMWAKHPSSTYAVQLARLLKMNLINQGVGGYYFDERSLDVNLPYVPDLITVAYGGNEGRICPTIQDFEKLCSAFMEKLVQRFPKARIFVIPPTWRKSYYTPMSLGTSADIARAIHEVCRTLPNVKVFDGLELTPHSERYYTDGLHPTDEGFLHFVINMLPDILKSCR